MFLTQFLRRGIIRHKIIWNVGRRLVESTVQDNASIFRMQLKEIFMFFTRSSTVREFLVTSLRFDRKDDLNLSLNGWLNRLIYPLWEGSKCPKVRISFHHVRRVPSRLPWRQWPFVRYPMILYLTHVYVCLSKFINVKLYV